MADATLSDSQIEELQRLLDSVPAPLEPLDVSMLDGFLCGVLLQPQRIPESAWLQSVTDVERRPHSVDPAVQRIHELVLRRHAGLERAITRREWFDPWVFELSDDPRAPAASTVGSAIEHPAVYPWVAGFAVAMTTFPALLGSRADALTEPLALLYRHLDPGDLEDADELLEAIDALPPARTLAEAVEDLVRATLLLADVARPLVRAAERAPRQHSAKPR